jgi:hypothetical protein
MTQESEQATVVKKEGGKGRKWFGKIPSDMILSPGGVILLLCAFLLEASDLILPPSLADSMLIELIPEIGFAIMLRFIAGVPFTAQIIPMIIERIPFVSDFFPTFLGYFF